LTAEDVIERHIASLGGRELLERIRSLSYHGRITVQGVSGTIEAASKAPGKSYQKIDLGVFVEESGFDGAVGWKRGTKGTRRLSGEELVQARENAIFNRILHYRNPEVFAEVRLAGEDRETPAGEHVVEMVLASGTRFRSWFDAETFHEVKRVMTAEVDGKQFERQVWFTDYRPLEGRQVHYGIRQLTPFNELQIVIDEYRILNDDTPGWWEDASRVLASAT
jgi:hypothetical protein